MFGVRENGNSIVVCSPGYRPYFYASAPTGFNSNHIQRTKELLNANIKVVENNNANMQIYGIINIIRRIPKAVLGQMYLQ
jgi:hypothetical protein